MCSPDNNNIPFHHFVKGRDMDYDKLEESGFGPIITFEDYLSVLYHDKKPVIAYQMEPGYLIALNVHL